MAKNMELRKQPSKPSSSGVQSLARTKMFGGVKPQMGGGVKPKMGGMSNQLSNLKTSSAAGKKAKKPRSGY